MPESTAAPAAAPSPTVLALQAEAAEALARHRDPATTAASRIQHDDLRTKAAEGAAAWRGRRT